MGEKTILVAEIGSTTTLLNAFSRQGNNWEYLGQGQAATTVLTGDVNQGLAQATKNLSQKLGRDFKNCRMLAASSAAGGLKMTVHGLVYQMTVKAAQEAALGAGAILHMVTAGPLRPRHLAEINFIKPNIILLAGGVDYGEENIILDNAEKIAQLPLNTPVIYAGNKVIAAEVEHILQAKGKQVLIADNVYPAIDTFNVEPTRALIQEVFEEHIVKAPGMAKIREMVAGSVMPTPGAVMQGAKLLQKAIGDLMVIDVGGATTDIHSVTNGSSEIRDILISPEPFAKRTVEGDLGVFVNALNVIKDYGEEQLALELGFSPCENIPSPLPQNDQELKLLAALTKYAVEKAIKRHVGFIKDYYGPTGKKVYAQGKDLTNIEWIIGTGGALTNLKNRIEILKSIQKEKSKLLLPRSNAEVLIDNDYIMGALGVLSREEPQGALSLLLKSLHLNPQNLQEILS